MDKLKTALILINSSTIYDNYLYYINIGDNIHYKEYQKILSKNKVITKYNKVLFCSLIFLIIKEKVVDNIGNLQYKSKIYDNYLDQLVGLIAKKKNNKFILDGYEFDNASKVISTIRNKFAHGDYMISDNENKIIFNKEGTEIKVDINLLSIIGISLNQNLDIILKDKPINRNLIGIIGAKNQIKGNGITNKEELLKVFDRIYIYNFDIKGMEGKKINLYEINLIKKNLDILANEIGKPDYKVKKNKFIDEMYKRKILVTQTKKKYSSYKEHELLLNQIENIKDFYKFSIDDQLVYLAYLSNDTLEDKDGRLIIQKGCKTNISLLSALEEIENFDIIENDLDIKEKEEFLVSNVEQSVSSAIQKFWAVYGYPLDNKIYKEFGEQYTLDRDNSFDFGKLNLSEVKPLVLNINDKPLKDIISKVDKIILEYNKLNQKIKDFEIKFEKIKNMSHPEKEKILRINKELLKRMKDEERNLLTNLKESIDLRIKIEDDFKNNYDYFRNKAIIMGIRNSIAHGNIEVNKYDVTEELNSVMITFRNIHKGNVFFELTISYEYFELLYSGENTNVLKDFFMQKLEKNKEKIL